MSTKTQKEFKKQMKALEKEGKLSEQYYARRRISYGSGASILFILILLWRFGIFGMIFSAFTFFSAPQDLQNNFSRPEETEISTYYETGTNTDNLISNIYLDIYKYFYEKKQVSADTFTNYKDDLPSVYESVVTEIDSLKDLSDNYNEDLDVTSDMLDFAIAHYGDTLTEQEKRYLDTLSKKSQSLYDKRLGLWSELWDNYNY